MRMYIFVLGVKVSGQTVYTNTVHSWGTSLDNAHNNRWLEDELLENDVVILNAYYVSDANELVKVV